VTTAILGEAEAGARPRSEEAGGAMPDRQRTVDVGARAPVFTLRHTFARDVALQEALDRGPVVLAFYVFDFGGV
jgi:hypothetical protein